MNRLARRRLDIEHAQGGFVCGLIRRPARLHLPLAASAAFHAAPLCCASIVAESDGRPDGLPREHDPRRSPLRVEIYGEARNQLPVLPAPRTSAAETAEQVPLTRQQSQQALSPLNTAKPSAAPAAKGVLLGGGDDCRITGFRFCSS